MELKVKSKQLIKNAKTYSRPRPRPDVSRPRPRPEGSRPRPRPRPGWTGLEWSRDQDRGLEDYNTDIIQITLNNKHFEMSISNGDVNSLDVFKTSAGETGRKLASRR